MAKARKKSRPLPAEQPQAPAPMPPVPTPADWQQLADQFEQWVAQPISPFSYGPVQDLQRRAGQRVAAAASGKVTIRPFPVDPSWGAVWTPAPPSVSRQFITFQPHEASRFTSAYDPEDWPSPALAAWALWGSLIRTLKARPKYAPVFEGGPVFYGNWAAAPQGLKAQIAAHDGAACCRLLANPAMWQGVTTDATATPTDQYVTLDQAAALVNRSKTTLRRRYDKGELPDPDVPGGGGIAHEWKWSKLRPVLQRLFGRELHDRFPSHRR